MKRKLVLIMAAVILASNLTACKNSENTLSSDNDKSRSTQSSISESVLESKNSDTESKTEVQPEISEPEQGKFDIENVRKQISIKGQPFEIPMALRDLKDGWTWKEHENTKYCDDGHGLAYIYYNGEEMFVAGLENYFDGAKDNGIIYNLTIETNDCSIDGLLPIKSTKQDVVGKYGEPVKINKYGSYYYGTVNDSDSIGGIINEQRICVEINDDDTIKSISITYADLTKEN